MFLILLKDIRLQFLAQTASLSTHITNKCISYRLRVLILQINQFFSGKKTIFFQKYNLYLPFLL